MRGRIESKSLENYARIRTSDHPGIRLGSPSGSRAPVIAAAIKVVLDAFPASKFSPLTAWQRTCLCLVEETYAG